MTTERYLTAGRYRLDLRDERLWCGGAAARLGGKSFALLRALMESPQTLITKSELFDRVWPGLAVSESVLTTAVKEVRRALGDDARRPSVIETVHRRGYRFLLPVERHDIELPAEAVPQAAAEPRAAASTDEATGRRWLIVGVLALGAALLLWLVAAAVYRPASPAVRAAPAAAHAKSVAVLPFADFSPTRDQRWFADGLTEEIVNRLARTPDLRVASRTAAARLPAARLATSDIARALGVAHVLEGSVRRSGGRVRVTAELVRAADGMQLWSQTYDRPSSDMISIQEDIAFAIAAALKTVMEPATLRAMVAAGTRSVEAYETYLHGLALDQRQFAEGDIAFARAAAEAYERARALDPGFAAAHWRAAQTWFGNATRVDASIRDDGPSEAERLANFNARVDRAIATSTDAAESLKYRAARAAMLLRFAAAHRLMARYLDMRPRDIDAWEQMADLSAYAGKRDWMARAAERIHTLSIEEGNPRSRAITVSVMALRLDAALARAREQLALQPDKALTQYQAHRAFLWAGRTGDARALVAQIAASDMPEDTKLTAALRQACAERRLGDARALHDRLGAIGDLSARWQAAQIFGDTAAAAALLRPLDKPDRLPTLMQFMIHPTFDARPYPVLSATLTRNGVARPPPVAMPFACAPAAAGVATTQAPA